MLRVRSRTRCCLVADGAASAGHAAAEAGHEIGAATCEAECPQGRRPVPAPTAPRGRRRRAAGGGRAAAIYAVAACRHEAVKGQQSIQIHGGAAALRLSSRFCQLHGLDQQARQYGHSERAWGATAQAQIGFTTGPPLAARSNRFTAQRCLRRRRGRLDSHSRKSPQTRADRAPGHHSSTVAARHSQLRASGGSRLRSRARIAHSSVSCAG